MFNKNNEDQTGKQRGTCTEKPWVRTQAEPVTNQYQNSTKCVFSFTCYCTKDIPGHNKLLCLQHTS